MHINVSFVDLRKTIYVSRRLWESGTDLESVLDQMSPGWVADKIYVAGQPITPNDFKKCLGDFHGCDIQIEYRK